MVRKSIHPKKPPSQIAEFLNLLDVSLVHSRKDPRFKITIPSKVQAYLAVGKPILKGVESDAVGPMAGALYSHYGKRILDVSISCAFLGLGLPVWFLLYVVARCSLGSPVLFRQRRPGYLGKPFTMYKLRTMTNARDSNGRLSPDEKRITRVGTILRRLSLDELPELFNVMKGEMSLVGPRPLLMQYLQRYTPEQARRHDVAPGITGWAQIRGRNALTWEEKFVLDVWYVDHQSFTLDLYILLVTFWKVLSREGIGYEGFVSAPEFMGSSNDQRDVHQRGPKG